MLKRAVDALVGIGVLVFIFKYITVFLEFKAYFGWSSLFPSKQWYIMKTVATDIGVFLFFIVVLAIITYIRDANRQVKEEMDCIRRGVPYERPQKFGIVKLITMAFGAIMYLGYKGYREQTSGKKRHR